MPIFNSQQPLLWSKFEIQSGAVKSVVLLVEVLAIYLVYFCILSH